MQVMVEIVSVISIPSHCNSWVFGFSAEQQFIFFIFERFDENSSGNEDRPEATDDEDMVLWMNEWDHLKAELDPENDEDTSDDMSSNAALYTVNRKHSLSFIHSLFTKRVVCVVLGRCLNHAGQEISSSSKNYMKLS